MKKMWWITLSLLSIPFALADITGTLSNVWWKTLSIGNLTFLGMSDGSTVVALTRLLIGILVFAIFFAIIAIITGMGASKGGSPLSMFNRGQAAIISGLVAIIAAIFLPAQVLLATGSTWAIAVAFLLIGGPIFGIFYIMWTIPNKHRGYIFLKLILCLLLFWILSAVKYHVGRMA